MLNMKYYIISGEASGDLHGSNLIKNLKKYDSEAEFRCWGGDLMEKQGVTLVRHYRDLAFMGFLLVLLNTRTIFRNIRFCKKDIISWKPDVLILIDYPGFNLRIAEYAKKNGLRVFYYISPTVWAWHSSRVKTIKKYVDRMFVILPFEKDFYKQHGYDVDFAGHPLLDAIEERKNKNENFGNFINRNKLPDKPVIALLPGSRKQEIKNILPVMLRISDHFPDYQFIIGAASSIDNDYYQIFTDRYDVPVIFDQTYELLKQSTAAIVTSGTATLETALFSVPQIVCYRLRGISFIIAKMLVNVKYISLVNLIMDKEVVKEYIQEKLTVENVRNGLESIINDPDNRNRIFADYNDLINRLGGAGASQRIAKIMTQNLLT